MQKSISKDMTAGNPLKVLLMFAIPMLIGNVIQLCYNIVDSIVVGQFISVKALAAIGSTGGILFLMISFIIGLTMGISIISAQYFGAKNEKMLKNALTTSVYISIAAAVILGIVGVTFAKPVLRLLNTPADIIDLAAAYLYVNFTTAIAPIVYNMLAGIIRSMGDSKTPLYALIISSVTNIILVLFVVRRQEPYRQIKIAVVLNQ
jgi:Na+-driven multidrug efflux pump